MANERRRRSRRANSVINVIIIFFFYRRGIRFIRISLPANFWQRVRAYYDICFKCKILFFVFCFFFLPPHLLRNLFKVFEREKTFNCCSRPRILINRSGYVHCTRGIIMKNINDKVQTIRILHKIIMYIYIYFLHRFVCLFIYYYSFHCCYIYQIWRWSSREMIKMSLFTRRDLCILKRSTTNNAFVLL